jgi:copper(I)-binding protein
MKKSLLASLLLLPVISWANIADNIEIEDAYVRETLENVHTTAGYAIIKNNSESEVFVVGAKSPKVKKTELHTIEMRKGVARMVEVKKIAVPANGSVNLEPGSFHLMLFTVDVPLQGKNEVPMIFKFNDGSTKEVKMKVRDVRAPWQKKPMPIPAE